MLKLVVIVEFTSCHQQIIVPSPCPNLCPGISATSEDVRPIRSLSCFGAQCRSLKIALHVFGAPSSYAITDHFTQSSHTPFLAMTTNFGMVRVDPFTLTKSPFTKRVNNVQWHAIPVCRNSNHSTSTDGLLYAHAKTYFGQNGVLAQQQQHRPKHPTIAQTIRITPR